MADKSIAAYDLPERVASYDANMEIMHPNRARMVQVALDVLPFSTDLPLTALDLGVGTGYFAERFLGRYPRASLAAVDGAAAMIDLARTRLGAAASRVEFVTGDLRQLSSVLRPAAPFDVAFSSFALHHLDRDDKLALVLQVRERLKPGGWFLDADIVVSDSPAIEERIQQLRVDGILRRAPRDDSRFADAATLHRALAEMEAAEGDQPLTLADDLRILREAGLNGVTVFWLEYREAVIGGFK